MGRNPPPPPFLVVEDQKKPGLNRVKREVTVIEKKNRFSITCEQALSGERELARRLGLAESGRVGTGTKRPSVETTGPGCSKQG